MKYILLEKHPTEPHVWEIVDGLGGEWTRMEGGDRCRLLPVLHLLTPTKSFGIYHVFELTDEEYESVMGGCHEEDGR